LLLIYGSGRGAYLVDRQSLSEAIFLPLFGPGGGRGVPGIIRPGVFGVAAAHLSADSWVDLIPPGNDLVFIQGF